MKNNNLFRKTNKYKRYIFKYRDTRNNKKIFIGDDGSFYRKNQKTTLTPKRSTSYKYYDWTPLVLFLHSKEGHDWDEVYSSLKKRLKGVIFQTRYSPVFWIVQDNVFRNEQGELCFMERGKTILLEKDYYCYIGRESAYSRMYVCPESNTLKFINKSINRSPHASKENLEYYKGMGFTLTFNGRRLNP